MKKIVVILLIIVLVMGFLAGCTKPNEKLDVDLKQVLEAVKSELGEAYYPDRDIEIGELKDLTGLSDNQISEFIAQAPMMSLGVDTFIGIKSTDGNADIVYAGLEKYRKYLVEESFQYPMNLPKVNAAKAIQFGEYSFFIMLGEYNDSIEDVESDEAREYYESEVKRIESLIENFFK